jgi:hypothetical protein
MVKFGKHRPVILFLVAFAAVSVSSVPKAIAASVGFYAGTFILPPDHNKNDSLCFRGRSLHKKECGEIEKAFHAWWCLMKTVKRYLASTENRY